MPATTARARVALGISYNGLAYQGWQSQLSGQTVQDHVQRALAQIAGHPVNTLCAGRTDAGVHALMQVVHFDTTATRREISWVRGTNALLPHDIGVQWARVVPDDFHCRSHALSRRYLYVLLQSPVRPSFDDGRVGWSMAPLDLEAMQLASNALAGCHDFSSFRAAACQAHSATKTLQPIQISRRGAYWRFAFEADAFLHHMIRNIMGCLVAVGQGKHEPQWVSEVLLARSRNVAAPTFSANGLYFLGPRYAARWGLPERVDGYDGLP
jgi:tRNA pseudouridine38-40 synthase